MLKLVCCVIAIVIIPISILAQADTTEIVPADSQAVVSVAPPSSVLAVDHKYDNGDKIELTWVPSIDDVPGGAVLGYIVYRTTNNGEPKKVAELLPGVIRFIDEGLELDSVYSYSVAAFGETSEAQSVWTQELTTSREWLNLGRVNLFIIAVLISGAVIIYIRTASQGKKLFVRKIAGLEAVDDAIGRATEMGRPILFIPGIHDMDDVQTLAAITILGKISSQVADYDTKIRMPVARSLVMTAARETIKAAYQTAGRPDAYSDEMVNYVTDEQFGYVAAVDGIMVREKPATIFLLGAFFAESLILAETGNSIGAIQIAGTARPAQLPFFIAACDFTLIGEELFAASAYLSGEPKMLGSLKGQDIGKALAMLAIVIGVIALTIGRMFDIESFVMLSDWIRKFFTLSS